MSVIEATLSASQSAGMVFRLWMLSTHYRSPINYTAGSMRQSEAVYRKFLKHMEPSEESPPLEFVEALCDDLNTPKAITLLHEYVKRGEGRKLYASMMLIGLLPS